MTIREGDYSLAYVTWVNDMQSTENTLTEEQFLTANEQGTTSTIKNTPEPELINRGIDELKTIVNQMSILPVKVFRKQHE